MLLCSLALLGRMLLRSLALLGRMLLRSLALLGRMLLRSLALLGRMLLRSLALLGCMLACSSCCWCSMSAFIVGAPVNLVHSCCGRVSMVHFGKLGFILHGSVLVLHLISSRLDMAAAHCCLFTRIRPPVHTIRTIKGVMIVAARKIVVNIRIVNYRTVNMPCCTIVHKPVAGPSASVKAVATVSKSIIKTSVKTYMKSPISSVETI
jgi:hypothetical protein